MPTKRVARAGGPAGIIIETRDGGFYFLTTVQARSARIPKKGEFARFLKKSAGSGGGRKRKLGCRAIKKWLNSHSPNSAAWRRASLRWGGNC